MKVVNCQGAVRHSDTFNFGTRSHVDGFKYWNPSQLQPDIFQSPSEELVVENFSPSLHTWRQRKDRLGVIKHPAKRKSTTSSLFVKKHKTGHRNLSHTYIEMSCTKMLLIQDTCCSIFTSMSS